MSISEEGRPATGGQWCGSAWGYTVYYSETRSINLTLYLSRLSDQVGVSISKKPSRPAGGRNSICLLFQLTPGGGGCLARGGCARAGMI